MASLQPALITYYRQVHNEVVRTAQAFVETPTADWLHDLRVQLKRIRFIRHLVKHYGSGGYRHLFRHYLAIFKEAGRIRGHQMNRYRLTGTLDMAEPDVREKRMVRHFQRQLVHALKKIDHDYTRIEKRLSKISFPGEAAFVHDLENRVRTRITPYVFTDQLHRSRKRLKEIAYGAEVSEYIRTQLNLRFSMAVVAELEDKIGDWHDLALAYETPGLSSPTRERLLIQKKEKLDAVYRLVRAL